MTHILNLFRKSPFEPLYEHRLKVRECVDRVKPLFHAVFSGDKEEQRQLSKEISDFERQADDLKIEIRRIIPKGVFLPVNREDLLRYLKIQDDLADAVEDITVLLSIKELTAPPELAADIQSFVDTVLNVCYLAEQATDQLRPLVETGFKGEDAHVVMQLVEKAELGERNSDIASLALAQKLFALEDRMKPSDLQLWFHIFRLIGNLADYAKKTGELLGIMLAR